MSETKTGWELLHSPLPKAAFKPIPRDVYGVEGLTDVNEGHLIQRLHLSGLEWSEKITKSEYLGSEVRKTRGQNSYEYTVYLAHVDLELTIDGRTFSGSGAHDNRKVDAAFKGARTVAFKSACKDAGMFNELLVDGKSIDFFYTSLRSDEVVSDPPAKTSSETTSGEATGASSGSEPSATAQPSSAPSAAPEPPKIELTKEQATAVKWLLEKLPEDQRDEAKQAAWAKMRAAAVRDVKLAFRAGVDEMVRRHGGPETQVGKAVLSKLDQLDPQPQAA